MSTKHRLLLGAHMSIAGGLEQAIIRGDSIGCTAIQIFTKSNRQWHAKEITDADALLFQTTFKNSGIIYIAAHASYLINIGTPNHEINQKSVTSLITELQRCEILQIPYLILHPGNGLGMSEAECLKLIAQNINTALSISAGKTILLLENTAGQGHNTGYKFEQLATIINQVANQSRIGICLDTCHAYAAGYDLSTTDGYMHTWKEFKKHLGYKLLKFIHINDSKQTLGSRVDRHEDIGVGKIGHKGFELLFNDPHLFDIPKVLETPQTIELKDDIRNMQTIVNLLEAKNKNLLLGLKLKKYLK